MVSEIQQLKQQALKEIEGVKDASFLEAIWRKFLGRKDGALTRILRGIKDLTEEEKPKIGILANKVKKEIETKKAEEALKKVQETASAMEGLEVTISVKIGEEGQLYESITGQKISERLKETGFEIKRNQIELTEPIKELGEFPVKIKFEHNLEVEIRVIVTEEK